MDLELILKEYRQWGFEEAPQICYQISGGLTNSLYKIQYRDRALVLRIHNTFPKLLGIDRDREFRILSTLKNQNIAPELVYFHRNYSISEFISGRVWQKSDWKNPRKLCQLGSVVKRYQNLRMTLPPFDYQRHLTNYWSQFTYQNPGKARALHKDFQIFVRKISKTSLPRTLTHHDLHPGNVIESENRLKILDWEYAGWGYRGFDNQCLNHPFARNDYRHPSKFFEQLKFWLTTLWPNHSPSMR